MSAAENISDDVVRKVSGSPCYAAMRILPKAPRAAMYEIYAFCRAVGRLCLPGEVLREAGIVATEPGLVLSNPALARACAFVAEEARDHIQEADTIMARCRRRNARALSIMGDAYKLILDVLEHRGWMPPRHPVRVGRPQLLWILLRHAF